MRDNRQPYCDRQPRRFICPAGLTATVRKGWLAGFVAKAGAEKPPLASPDLEAARPPIGGQAPWVINGGRIRSDNKPTSNSGFSMSRDITPGATSLAWLRPSLERQLIDEERKDLSAVKRNLKPKIFIGSSRESKEIADAIDHGLRPEAEPTVWAPGGFDLSENTLAGLMRSARESDFGIFVFAGDDTTEIRGQQLKVPRDNVIYELGLFTGHLGLSRCFFVAPRDLPIRIPTDLQGITFEQYDSTRSDGNWKAEMNSFCSRVKDTIKIGYWLYEQENYLMELATQYECCNWIIDERARVERKDYIWQLMIRASKNNVSKVMLVKQGRIGCYVAFAAAVISKPEANDRNLFLSIEPKKLTATNARYKLVEAILAINEKISLNMSQKQELRAWALAMPDLEQLLAQRVVVGFENN